MTAETVSAAPVDGSVPLPPPAPGAPSTQPAPSAAPAPAATKQLDDLPTVIEEFHSAAGRAPTGVTYANHVRRFLRWLKDKGIDSATMPPTTADQFLAAEYTNLITRNVAASSLGLLNEAAIQHGVPFSVQTPTRVKTPRTRAATPPAPQPALAPQSTPALAPVPIPTAGPGAQPVAVPSAVAQIGAPKASSKKPTSVLPSLGGRIRVSKRISGSEGTGAPIGSLALIGTYSLDDIEGEGSIANFIANFIRPHYGPRPGENAATYYVDRLDNLGNPIPNATVQIPIFPELGPQAAVSTSAAPPPHSLGSTGDRFLDFSLRRLEEMEQRYEDLRTKYEEQVQAGKMDPGMMALLLERERPKVVDAKSLREEFTALERGANGPSTPAPASALDGLLSGLSAQPRNDATIDALTGMVRDLTTKVTDLASKPPQPIPAARDPVELFSGMLTAFSKMAELSRPPPIPEDPIRSKLIDAALTKVISPEKPKTLPEVISEMKALRDAQEFLGGGPQEKPGFGDILLGLIEHSDKVGAAIGNVVAKIPQLPQGPAKEQKPAQIQAAAPSKTPPLPEGAKRAFVQLRDLPANEDQEIVSALYTILQEVGGAPPPWPTIASHTIKNFGRADSRPEIRSLITQLFIWCGAKSLASEEVIEKVTNVLHRNYTFLHATMFNGDEKHLTDESLTARPESAMEPSDEQLVEMANEHEGESEPEPAESEDEESEDAEQEPAEEPAQEEEEEDRSAAVDMQRETPRDQVSSGVVV